MRQSSLLWARMGPKQQEMRGGEWSEAPWLLGRCGGALGPVEPLPWRPPAPSGGWEHERSVLQGSFFSYLTLDGRLSPRQAQECIPITTLSSLL